MDTGWKILLIIISIQAASILYLMEVSEPPIAIYGDDAHIPQQYLQSTSGETPYVLSPNLDVVLQTTGPTNTAYRVQTNEAGFREGPIPGTGNRTVVAVLGDSMTFGWGLNTSSRLTERCEQQLQATDRGVRLINAGVPGFGMHDYRMLLQETVLNWQPDAVVIVFSRGDAVSARDVLGEPAEDPARRADRKQSMRDRRLSESSLLEHMNAIADTTTNQSIPLLFQSYWPFKPEERIFLREWAENRSSVIFQDTPNAFNEAGMAAFTFSREDPHLNAAAHSHLADSLCTGVTALLDLS